MTLGQFGVVSRMVVETEYLLIAKYNIRMNETMAFFLGRDFIPDFNVFRNIPMPFGGSFHVSM